MENQLFFFTIFVSLLLVLLMEARRIYKTGNLPPGPWKLPIIGNMHQLVGSPPHHCLTDLAKKHGPIMHLQLGQLSCVVISSPELAEEVMKTHDHITATRPFVLAASIIYSGRGMAFCPYGDYWRQVRKICAQELLGTKRVRSFRSVREEEMSHLITSIASSAGGTVNLTGMLTSLSYCITSRMALGNVRNQQRDAFIPIVEEILCVLGGFSVADLFPSIKLLQFITGLRSKLQKLHQEADEILEEIIREHRERSKFNNAGVDDLLSVLLNLQDHSMFDIPVTTQDIKAVILDMFVAGYEPPSTAIQWMMAEMVKHPKILERAQREVRRVFNGKEKIDETSLHDLTYMNSVIKESLRLHPAGPLLLPREAQERVEIFGYEIPEKTRIIINGQAILRDPHHWTEPEIFYPERFLNSSIDYKGTDFKFIPFGAGRRICPGMLHAMSVIQLVLANLLYHFDWKIPNGEKPENLDMSEIFGAAVRRKNDLCLIPIPYNPVQSNKS